MGLLARDTTALPFPIRLDLVLQHDIDLALKLTGSERFLPGRERRAHGPRQACGRGWQAARTRSQPFTLLNTPNARLSTLKTRQSLAERPI